jgi:CRP-like cAMP-binding protein
MFITETHHAETHHTGNRLLDQLGTRDFERLSQRMERQAVPLRGTFLRPNEPLRYAHFPVTNVLSSIVVLRDGSAVEAAAIGNEGVAGVGLLIGEQASPHLMVQQVEGESLRIPAGHFRAVLGDSPRLRDLVERYALILLRQCAQNAACNARHGAEERLSRWLLACADRAGRDEFDITQDYLGIMLGVSRQSVNCVIQSFRQQGLISYRRRRLRIINRPRLEHTTCECYEVSAGTYEDLMGPTAGRSKIGLSS